MTFQLQQVPNINTYICHMPAILQGYTCYIDASTAPDQPHLPPRLAGLGIFITNLQEIPTQMTYIKAKMQASTSVIMAEAAALALAAAIMDRLNLTGINYLSDNEQLVRFLNSDDHSNPPDWRIKPFTQVFNNHTTGTNVKVYKIHRSQNSTAHNLARQALQEAAQQNQDATFSCLSEHNVNPCQWLQALHDVDLHNVTITAALCC
jgi:hypothetical protein